MTYCEHREAKKSSFDRRSFRWIARGDVKLLIGCPKGQWQPRKQRCRVGTRLYRKLAVKRGGRCPAGSRRIVK